MDCLHASIADLQQNSQPDVEIIRISNSSISHIKNDFMKNFPKVMDIAVNNASIEHVDENSFQNNKRLRKIDVSDNIIRTIHVDVLKPTLVYELNVANNQELIILEAKAFLASNDLNGLNLIACNITQVYAETFAKLPALGILLLQGNRLETLPKDVFLKNQLLHNVDISQNKFKVLSPQVFLNLHEFLSVAFKSNPWDCENCEVVSLILWSKGKDLSEGVGCDKPLNKMWTDSLVGKPC